MKFISSIVAIVCLTLAVFATSSSAAVVGLTFEGLQDFEPVTNYYNGGLGGTGSGPGPNYGITFTPSAVGWIDSDAGGTGNFGGEPSPSTALWFLPEWEPPFLGEMMNVPDGFDTGFSFYYSSPNGPTGTYKIWSGLGGTGTVLTSFTLPATPNFNPGGVTTYDPFVPFGVTFAGTARSVEFAAFGSATFDNVTLGSAVPVPEPSTWLLAALGAGVAVIARRRKAKRRTAAAMCAALLILVASVATSQAAIVSYSFSGVVTSFQGTGTPAAAVLPGVELGDPFSGTVTYDTSSYSSVGFPEGYWIGGPPAISIVIDNKYSLDSTAPWPSRYIEDNVPGSGGTTLGVSVQNHDDHGGGMGVELSPHNGVFANLIDLFFKAGNLADVPPDLPSFDPLSPVFWSNDQFPPSPSFLVGVHGPSLLPENLGQDTFVGLFGPITSMFLVPEPSTLALAGLGLAAGLLCVARRRRQVAGNLAIARRAPFVLLLSAVVVFTARGPAFAEIKTYAFAGTYWQGEGLSVPLSDLLAGVEPGDPFSGTITYDSSAPSGDGQPLSISVVFDSEHRVTLHNSTVHSYINVLPPESSGGDDSLAVTVSSWGTPEPAFESNPAVFVSQMQIDLFAGNDTTRPTSMAELDLTSSIFTRKHLTMWLHGPSLYPDDLGREKTLMVIESIDSFTLVPEPTALALAAVGSLGIGVVALRACRTGVAV